MKPRVMAELLTQFVDRAIAGRDDRDAYLTLFESQRRELAPIFGMVKFLRLFLVKAEPSPLFVESLGAGLRLAASQAVRERAASERAWPVSPTHRKVVLGVAALGSLASIAAIFMISRSRAARTTA